MEIHERFEDMSPDGRLMVMIQDDGDVIISVIQSEEQRISAMPSVEFCSVGAGGGQSPYTREALANLYWAIKRDNEENPQHRN